MRIKRPKTLFAAALTAYLTVGALAGCSLSSAAEETTATVASGTSTTQVALTTDDALADAKDYTELAELADETWDEADEVAVTLDGDTAEASGDGVDVDGSTVTITAPGTYRLSGTLTDGQVVVSSEADGLVRLVLDGVDVTSSTTAAIAVMDADDVSVVLADGSENSLTDAAEYQDDGDEDGPNAALFSTADMVISGGGTLDVTGNSNDGITSKDGLVVAGGTIRVDAADDGVRGKDFLVVTGGTLDVTAADDGLKADNEDGTDDDGDTVGYAAFLGGDVTVSAGDDGVHAEADLVVADGTLTVTESVEGLEGAHILIAGGTTDVTASDDGLNASGATTTDDTATTGDGERPDGPPEGGPGGGMGGMGGGPGGEGAGDFSLAITGGTLTVDADGDGLDSNGTLTITGGDTTVHGPTMNGNGALDSNGGIAVSGGNLIAVGSSGMAETPDADSSQAWVAATFDTLPAGTELQVIGDGGAVLGDITLTKDTQSIVLSVADVVDGQTYTIVADGKEVATATAGEAIAGGMGGMGGGRQG
ncbi:carbohydrate-binding domain-containing protein [Myceligenerans indicum]|uniref:Carbohydrate-binding domain-containing protein n=1 Tax=Myceligenerans indicum TaxID=2593663 RepID=A0ABS1LRF1_9MICO|nr:carbohydrate-binding domain-containing protein [Myceligenerans indicum]MBL0888743.1 carbohydrate-binding domain-containing protein [Myceligenerans indicum]